MHLEFLLCLNSCCNDDKKLEESVFSLLEYTEFQGVMRGMSIIAIYISNPLRWLAANTHKLSSCNWSARHMSRRYDDLEESLANVIEDSNKFLDEDCMKNTFNRQKEMLSPFK